MKTKKEFPIETIDRKVMPEVGSHKFHIGYCDHQYWICSVDVARFLIVGKQKSKTGYKYSLGPIDEAVDERDYILGPSMNRRARRPSRWLNVAGVESIMKRHSSTRSAEVAALRKLLDDHIEPLLKSRAIKIAEKEKAAAEEPISVDKRFSGALTVLRETVIDVRDENKALKERIKWMDEPMTVARYLALHDIYLVDEVKRKVVSIARKSCQEQGIPLSKARIKYHSETGVINGNANLYPPEIIKAAIEKALF